MVNQFIINIIVVQFSTFPLFKVDNKLRKPKILALFQLFLNFLRARKRLIKIINYTPV